MNSAGFVNTDDDADDDARWVHTQHQTIYASPLPLRARYTVHIYGAVQWQLWNDLDNFDWRLLFLIVVLLLWVRSISHLQIVNYKFDPKVDCFNIRNYCNFCGLNHDRLIVIGSSPAVNQWRKSVATAVTVQPDKNASLS